MVITVQLKIRTCIDLFIFNLHLGEGVNIKEILFLLIFALPSCSFPGHLLLWKIDAQTL